MRLADFGDTGGLAGHRFHEFSTDTLNLPVGKNQLQPGDVVRRYTVGQSVRPAGIFRYISTNGAGLLAGGIRREIKPILFDGARQIEIHDSWLYHCAAV